MRRRATTSTLALRGCALALACLVPVSCAHKRSATRIIGSFLSGVGFHDRASWESAAVHLGPEQLRSGADPVAAIVAATGRPLEPSAGNPWGLYRQRSVAAAPCEIAVHVNGARAVPRDYGLDVTLDDLLRLRPPDAIELHVGPRGPLRDSTGCGVLLLWREDWTRLGDVDLTGSIAGTVVDQGPEPVVALRLDPSGRRTKLGPAGAFSFADVLPGPYELALFTAGGEIARHAVRVFAFEVSRVELRVGHRRRAADAIDRSARRREGDPTAGLLSDALPWHPEPPGIRALGGR